MQLSALVVGGNAVGREMASVELKRHGVRPLLEEEVTLHDASAAVLLDPEVIHLVSKYRATLPVVSVIHNHALEEECLRAGADEVVFVEHIFRPGCLAQAVRRAIARRSFRSTLEREARIDPLTELLNRRGMSEAISRVARRKGGAVALLVDVDDFKQVNERMGYVGADTMLRKVAEVLRKHARPTDIIGRFGGDEFIVVLSGVGFVAGCAVAERLREEIQLLGITVSIGLSEVYGDVTLEDVVLETQNLLKAGKVAGKNRVAVGARLRRPVFGMNKYTNVSA